MLQSGQKVQCLCGFGLRKVKGSGKGMAFSLWSCSVCTLLSLLRTSITSTRHKVAFRNANENCGNNRAMVATEQGTILLAGSIPEYYFFASPNSRKMLALCLPCCISFRYTKSNELDGR